jgi:hypothetical protein
MKRRFIMEYKLFGRKVDAEPELLNVLASKREVVWIGDEQPPIQLRQLKKIGIEFFPSSWIFSMKKKFEDREKLQGYLQTGKAWTIGWLPPRDPKSAESQVFLSATKLFLLPWLRTVGQDLGGENWKKAIPGLRGQLLEAVSSPKMLQPQDLIDNVLINGCINFEYASADAILALAWTHYLAHGPWPSIHSVATWNEATWVEDEEGDIIQGDPKGIAWILKPRSELGYRSPLGEWRASTKVACGFAIPDQSGLGIDVREQPAPTLWRSLAALAKQGVPAILEEKSRSLFANGEISQGFYSFLLAGTKLAKAPARPKMDTGDQATIDPRHHVVVEDCAKMVTSDGPVPFQKGISIRTAVTNFTGWASSGVAPCKLVFHILSERVLRGQLTNDQAAQVSQEALIGKVFDPWEEVVGTIKNTTRYPFTITNVSKDRDETEEFWIVTIRGHIAESSPIVKLRGPAKAQTVPYNLLEGYEFDWSHKLQTADLVLGAEELKLPQLTLIRGWANLMKREVLLTEGGDWVNERDHRDFLEWYGKSVKSTVLKIKIADPERQEYNEILEVMRLAGRRVDDQGYLITKIDYVIVPLVFGVESIPSSIRGGKTALTPAMFLSNTMVLRKVMEASGKSLEDVIYDDKWTLTKTSEMNLELPWAELVRTMKKAYPHGSRIKFLMPSGTEDVFIDWRVVELFSHGDLSPDDAFTMLLHRFLYHYSKAITALKNSGAQPWMRPEEEVQLEEWLKWEKGWQMANATLIRLKGAMASLGFSGGMLRRMVSPARITPFLVSVGLHAIPRGTVLLSPKTIEQHRIPWKRSGKTMLMRFPGDAFAPVSIRVSKRVPDGVIFCSTWDQQAGTKGDSDGDMNLVTDYNTFGALINMSRKDRELIARYFRMMGWNNTISPEAPLEIGPVEFQTHWPEEANKMNHRASFERYQMFTALADTPIVDWNKAVPMYDPNAPLATKFDLDSYINWGEQISRFNTSGIGHAYNTWHVAVLMMGITYKRSWDLYRVWERVAHLAATVYEDVFLAAGPKATQWTLFELLEKGKVEDLDKWKMALKALGISQGFELEITTRNDERVTIDIVSYLIKARVMVMAYQSHYSNGWTTKAQKETLGTYMKYVPILGLLRAVFSFKMKTSWMNKFPSNAEIRSALTLLHPESPIMAYYSEMLKILYPYAVACASAQSSEMYMRIMVE